jgi:hypothetical protein
MEKEKEKREAAEHSCVLRVMFALRRERFLSRLPLLQTRPFIRRESNQFYQLFSASY